jgi:anti-sigma regulatory factor (Ser/Thr protein kinase)
MPTKLTLRFDIDLTSLRIIRRLAADVVREQGGSAEAASAMETVAGELLTNAFEHAYHHQSGPLEIILLYDRTKIEFTIHDDGEPVTDAPMIPKSLPPGPRGRGLYLVGQLTDEAEVLHPRDDNRGVAVRVVKYLHPTRTG